MIASRRARQPRQDRAARFYVGESVFIEVEDDGRGIDKERVAERALLARLDRFRTILDTQPRSLDLRSGLFYARRGGWASGRGVGMAVVKKTVLEIGARLTRHGRWAWHALHDSVPLTLAIADALIVSAGGQRYAVRCRLCERRLKLSQR